METYNPDIGYILHHERREQKHYSAKVAVFDLHKPVTEKADPDFEFGFRCIGGGEIYFNGVPSSEELNKRIESIILGAFVRANNPVSESPVMLEKTEVERVLVEKGYLIQGQTLEQLEVKR